MIYVANSNIGMTGGGDAVVAMEIINSLSSNGFEVAAFSRRYNIPDNLAKDFLNIKHFKFPFIPVKEKYSNQKFGFFRYLLKKAQSDFYLKLLHRQFTKYPPELIIANDFTTARYLLNKYKNQAKIICVVHSIPEFYDIFKGENIEEHINIIERANFTLFVSKESRNKWVVYKSIDIKKTGFIYNCANESLAKKYLRESKNTVRKRLNMSPDKFYLLSVASFNYEKGLDLLLKAAPELKKIAPNLEILLIGSDTAKYFDSFKEKANNEVDDYLRVLGFKSNAMEYIYATDAFILPSRVEAFPLVILESMILKTPVLASSVGGIPEMIVHGKSGLLFEKENLRQIIKCFKKIYVSHEQRNRFVEESSKRYWDNFSKEKFTERYVNFTQNLIQ